MKLQATIAVSKLVGEGSNMDPIEFKTTLQAVGDYAQKDPNVPSHFKAEVLKLSERLFTVLLNSIKIQEFSYDPEMTADLYWEISRGYAASPDLRAAWLQNLATYHESVRSSGWGGGSRWGLMAVWWVASKPRGGGAVSDPSGSVDLGVHQRVEAE